MASVMATRTLQDARVIKVAVVPLGGMSKERYQHFFSILNRTQSLNMQSLTAPSDWRRMKSPFKALDWYDGTLLFEYVPVSAPGGGLSDLDDIQASRRVVGAVGLLEWQEGVEQMNIEAELMHKLKAYRSVCVKRYFVFGFPFDNQAALPTVANASESLTTFPPDDDVNSNNVTYCHCQMVMSEMAVRVILHFEGLISSGEHIVKAKAGKYPAWVLATTAFDDPNDSSDSKKLKKRMSGRVHKLIGDMCMQVCSPRDALEHYNVASSDCKAQADMVWYASALEGIASSILLLWELDRPVEDIIRDVRDAEGDADRAERIYRYIEERLIDALSIYSKQQNYAMLEVELCFKFARTLATSNKLVQHGRTLDYLLRALSVPGLGIQQQIECTLEAGLLCKRMGLWRKQALFMYLASLLSADLGNDHASHAIARCAATLYGVTYEGRMLGAQSLTSEYDSSVVTTSPSSSFAIMRRVLLAQIASYAAESDDPIAATRYYAALLRLMGQSEAQKEHYRKLISTTSAKLSVRTLSCPEPSEEPNLMPLLPRPSFRLMSDITPKFPSLTPSVSSGHDDDNLSQASDFLKSSMRRFKVPEIASRVRSLLRVGRTDKVEDDHVLSVLEEIPLEAQEDALQFMLSVAQRLPPACPVNVTGLPGLISLRPLQLSAGLCPIVMTGAPAKAVESSFFFSPFEQRRKRQAGSERKALWCVNTVGKVVVVFSNPLAVPLRIHHVSVVADGVNCSAYSGSLQIPAQTSAFEAVLTVKPMSAGQLRIRGVRFHIFNAMHFLPIDAQGNGATPHDELARPWEYPRRPKQAVMNREPPSHAKSTRSSREDVTGVPIDSVDVAPALPELNVRLGWTPQAVEINAGECRIEWIRLENVSELEPIRDMQTSVTQTMIPAQPNAKDAKEPIHEIVRNWTVLSDTPSCVTENATATMNNEEKSNPFISELASEIVRGYSGHGVDVDVAVWEQRILEAERQCSHLLCIPLLPSSLQARQPPEAGSSLLGPQQHVYLPILLRHVPSVKSFSINMKYTSMMGSDSANLERFMRQATAHVDVSAATAVRCTRVVLLTPSVGLSDGERRQLAEVLHSKGNRSDQRPDAATEVLNSMTAYCTCAVTITNRQSVAVHVAKNPCDVLSCLNQDVNGHAAGDGVAPNTPSTGGRHHDHQTLVISAQFSATIPAQSSRTFLMYLPRVYSTGSCDNDLVQYMRGEIERHCNLYWCINYSQSPRRGVVPFDSTALDAEAVRACLLPCLSLEHVLPTDMSVKSHKLGSGLQPNDANEHVEHESLNATSDVDMANFTAEAPLVELLSPMSISATPKSALGSAGYQVVTAGKFHNFTVNIRNESMIEPALATVLIVVAADDPSNVNTARQRIAVLPPSVVIMGQLEHRNVEIPPGGCAVRSVKLNFTAPGLFKVVCCFRLKGDAKPIGNWWCEDVPAKVRVIIPSI